ncbi:MAG: phosphoglycerate dehydrogenase [Candidatus Bipolaricaulota bacterium]
MGLTVLLSAPYMIPVFGRFKELFDRAGIEVLVAQVEERLSEDQLLQYASRIDGVICGDDRFTERVLQAMAPRLKVISKWGTGIDSIDTAAAQRLGIRVCNTPGAFTDAVADSVMGYILAFARRLPWMDRAMKAGRWEKMPGVALHECTLGVVGVGNIGKAVLRRAKAFGMRLLGNDIVPIPEEFVREVGVRMTDLSDLAARADFLSLSCDLNPTSRHLANRELFARMRPSAVLINTSRGAVVDEMALIGALRDSRIAGAALDVFEDEPLPQDNPLRFTDNVLLAPHNANSSPSAWERVHRNTLRNLFLGLELVLPPELAEE